ncbi:Putative lipase; SGNH-hydrolase domain (plasmid) [Methylorubrum extorquens DM4]|uniref:Lipase SGNH-hydrolase domain n=1 Tax=Methylorubrum extorquens (strain DSM 6343 / CIP 106787 / DM4) TaxID=661410 RepID=A0A2P9HAY0_METED|nr:SGNH/GDSL hydrolase family protein [Methylorubrum extorquens]SPK02058.1 Putative lipase; SGNH-hydrolase domain [Methylorubrum extorquens DM4]
MTKVLVLGGSNSVGSSGYVGYIKRHYENISAGKLEIINISVGGGSTLSGAARLIEASENIDGCDILLYEYGINDALTYRQAADAKTYYRISLKFLIDTAAKLFPDAKFVPVIFAHQHWYSPDSFEPVREERSRIFRELDINEIDIAGWLYRVFEGTIPDFLYADPAHYQRPSMCHLIGSIIAERLNHIVGGCNHQTVSRIAARYYDIYGDDRIKLRYLSARKICEMLGGNRDTVTFSNTLLSVDVLRINSGSTLSFHGFSPLLLVFKSDRKHGYVRAQFGSRKIDISTVYDGIGKLPWVHWSLSVPICADIPLSEVLPCDIDYISAFEVRNDIKNGSVFQFFQEPLQQAECLDIIGVLTLASSESDDSALRIEVIPQ